MTQHRLATLNSTSFIICIVAIFCAVIIGGLGVWGVVPPTSPDFWRTLATCGILFTGSIFASLAIRCFKTNE